MTGRFAGSRVLDERRRRWLAKNAGPHISVSSASNRSRSKSDASQSEASPDPQLDRVGHYPLPRLVAPELWKIALLFLTIVAAVTALIVYGSRAQAGTSTLPAEVNALLDISYSSVLPWSLSLLLVLSGQLTLIIGWARSQSPSDFAGHYRIWKWVGGLCWAIALCLPTGAHVALSATLYHYWSVQFWQQVTLGWLLPTYVACLSLFWLVQRDMRRCWFSRSLLFLAGGAALAHVAHQLQVFAAPHPLFASLTSAAAVACLFGSLLFHTRFVIYISADPPVARRAAAKKPARSVRGWLRRLWQRKPASARPSVELPAEGSPEESSRSASESQDEPEAAESKPKPVAKRKTRAKKKTTRTARATTKARSTADSADEQDTATESEPSAAAHSTKARTRLVATAVNTAAAEETEEQPADSKNSAANSAEQKAAARSSEPDVVPMHVEIDPDELKGLTKKQRRALRKQRREQQRQMQQAKSA